MCIKICVIQLNKLTFKVETIKKKIIIKRWLEYKDYYLRKKTTQTLKVFIRTNFTLTNKKKKKKLIKDNIFSNSLHLVALQNLMLRRLIL